MWTYAWITFILVTFVSKFYFPSSLYGLMPGQLLYLQLLLTSSFVLIWTYALIVVILTTFVCFLSSLSGLKRG